MSSEKRGVPFLQALKEIRLYDLIARNMYFLKRPAVKDNADNFRYSIRDLIDLLLMLGGFIALFKYVFPSTFRIDIVKIFNPFYSVLLLATSISVYSFVMAFIVNAVVLLKKRSIEYDWSIFYLSIRSCSIIIFPVVTIFMLIVNRIVNKNLSDMFVGQGIAIVSALFLLMSAAGFVISVSKVTTYLVPSARNVSTIIFGMLVLVVAAIAMTGRGPNAYLTMRNAKTGEVLLYCLFIFFDSVMNFFKRHSTVRYFCIVGGLALVITAFILTAQNELVRNVDIFISWVLFICVIFLMFHTLFYPVKIYLAENIGIKKNTLMACVVVAATLMVNRYVPLKNLSAKVFDVKGYCEEVVNQRCENEGIAIRDGKIRECKKILNNVIEKDLPWMGSESDSLF